MASLTGQTISSTYDSLLKVADNGPITSTPKTITDGLGNSSSLQLSTLGAIVNGTIVGQSSLDISAEIYHRNNIAVLNKLGNSWISWATRNTSGSDAVINLSNIGTLTLNSTISNGTYTYTLPSATGTLALTSALNSYVPTTRQLTINGTAYDLSADRTWSVGTVTSVGATAGIGISVSGSPITSSGSLTITNTAPDQTVVLTNGTGISVTGAYPNFTIASTITQYTDALARASLSFVAGSGAYNSTTGAITIPTNNNQITNGAGYITSAALSSYVPYTGATTDIVLGTYGVEGGYFQSSGGGGISALDSNISVFSDGSNSWAFGGNYGLYESVGTGSHGWNQQLNSSYGLDFWYTANGSSATKFANLTATGVFTLGSTSGTGTGAFHAGTGNFTGQLTLGSTITNGTYTYTLPSATGTLALTSALGSYLPLTGGTLTGALSGTSATFSGNVGIGTTSPYQAKLDVSGINSVANISASNASLDQLLIGSVDRAVTPVFFGLPNGSAFIGAIGNGVNNTLGLGTFGAAPIIFGTTNIERMRITSGGNVGIKTTTPYDDLDVIGSVGSSGGFWAKSGGGFLLGGTGGTGASYAFIGGDGDSSTASYLTLNTGVGEAMRVFHSRNVGIGTTTDAGYKLDVNGTGRFSGALELVGDLRFNTNSTERSIYFRGSTGVPDANWKMGTYLSPAGATVVTSAATVIDVYDEAGYGFMLRNTSNAPLLQIVGNTGAATFSNLAGTGTRMVVSDSTGLLSTQAIPGGGGGGSVDELQVALLSQVFG